MVHRPAQAILVSVIRLRLKLELPTRVGLSIPYRDVGRKSGGPN
jgi:hypothetical protein